MFVALKNVYDSEDVNTVWENTEEHIGTSAKESKWKQIKPWIDE
jgi:hypothetical protein